MRGSVRILGTVGVVVAAAVIATSVAVGAHAPAPVEAASITPLPDTGSFDYQLGGDYTPPSGVTIVSRDSSGKPVSGDYNICYVNGFQTQGQDKNFWLKKHPTLVVRLANGKPVHDPGWPDEMILNTSTKAKRTAIAKIMGKTITECATKGFQAVEFDNLDSYTRSHHKLTITDNIYEARDYVRIAHKLGLAAAQKNTPQLKSKGPKVIGFDFATAEECYKYDECNAYTREYGDKVLDIEYTDNLRGSWASDCASSDRPSRMILRDRDLTTPSSKKYVYEACSS